MLNTNVQAANSRERTQEEASTDTKYPRQLSEIELEQKLQRGIAQYKSNNSSRAMTTSNSPVSLSSGSNSARSTPTSFSSGTLSAPKSGLFRQESCISFERSTDGKFYTISADELGKKRTHSLSSLSVKVDYSDDDVDTDKTLTV